MCHMLQILCETRKSTYCTTHRRGGKNSGELKFYRRAEDEPHHANVVTTELRWEKMDKKYAEKSIFRSKFCAPDRSATEHIWLSSSVNIQRNRREKRAACLILHFGKKKEKPSSVYVRTTPFERGKECLVFASPTTMVQFPNSQQAPKSTFLNWKRPFSSTLSTSLPSPSSPRYCLQWIANTRCRLSVVLFFV